MCIINVNMWINTKLSDNCSYTKLVYTNPFTVLSILCCHGGFLLLWAVLYEAVKQGSNLSLLCIKFVYTYAFIHIGTNITRLWILICRYFHHMQWPAGCLLLWGVLYAAIAQALLDRIYLSAPLDSLISLLGQQGPTHAYVKHIK